MNGLVANECSRFLSKSATLSRRQTVVFKQWRTLNKELMGWRIAAFKMKGSYNYPGKQFLFKMIFLIERSETFLHKTILSLPSPFAVSHTLPTQMEPHKSQFPKNKDRVYFLELSTTVKPTQALSCIERSFLRPWPQTRGSISPACSLLLSEPWRMIETASGSVVVTESER